MRTVSLADAKARLSELLDRVREGEEISITRHGKPVAQLTSAEKVWKPIDVDELETFIRSMPEQEESGADFIRRMREEDRY